MWHDDRTQSTGTQTKIHSDERTLFSRPVANGTQRQSHWIADPPLTGVHGSACQWSLCSAGPPPTGEHWCGSPPLMEAQEESHLSEGPSLTGVHGLSSPDWNTGTDLVGGLAPKWDTMTGLVVVLGPDRRTLAQSFVSSWNTGTGLVGGPAPKWNKGTGLVGGLAPNRRTLAGGSAPD